MLEGIFKEAAGAQAECWPCPPRGCCYMVQVQPGRLLDPPLQHHAHPGRVQHAAAGGAGEEEPEEMQPVYQVGTRPCQPLGPCTGPVLASLVMPRRRHSVLLGFTRLLFVIHCTREKEWDFLATRSTSLQRTAPVMGVGTVGQMPSKRDLSARAAQSGEAGAPARVPLRLRAGPGRAGVHGVAHQPRGGGGHGGAVEGRGGRGRPRGPRQCESPSGNSRVLQGRPSREGL